MRHLAVDRSIYLVDDRTRTYRFERRNPAWRRLDPRRSIRNELQLDGYTRVFASGRTRTFHYDEAPTRRQRRLRALRRRDL